MAAALYIVDSDGDELWRIDDPTNPGSAVNEGDFPFRALLTATASRRTAGRST